MAKVAKSQVGSLKNQRERIFAEFFHDTDKKIGVPKYYLHKEDPSEEKNEKKGRSSSRIFMDYYQNGTFRDFLSRRKTFMTLESKLEYLLKVETAIFSVHSSKVEHLDLKPDNIVVDRNNRFLLIDFAQSQMHD